MEELNIYRNRAGSLDFDMLLNDIRARPGDTLTLHSYQDLGPRSITAASVLAVLSVRGIKISCEALCEPFELIGNHQKWVTQRKNRAMLKAKKESGNMGGRKKTPESFIATIYNQIAAGEYTMKDFSSFNTLSESAFRNGVNDLGWPWPPTQGGDGQ